MNRYPAVLLALLRADPRTLIVSPSRWLTGDSSRLLRSRARSHDSGATDDVVCLISCTGSVAPQYLLGLTPELLCSLLWRDVLVEHLLGQLVVHVLHDVVVARRIRRIDRTAVFLSHVDIPE